MTATPSVEDVILTTLSSYLATQIVLVTGLSASGVVNEWPEPTAHLNLSQTRVVISVSRGGAGKEQNRLGPPVMVKANGDGTFVYDCGSLSQPVDIGVWACTKGLRDDVDNIVFGLMNQPRYSTVPVLASTTLSVGVTKTGIRQLVTPVSMTGISPGVRLKIGTTDWLNVDSISATGFYCTPYFTHSAGETVVEVPGTYETAASGLSLRVSSSLDLYAGAVVNYLCQDGVRTFDASTTSQMQEWRSLRTGNGRCRLLRRVTAQPNLHTYTSIVASPAPLAVNVTRVS